jgi:hypothetical protein
MFQGIIFLVLGIILCLSVVGSPFGLASVCIGAWLISDALKKN